MDAAQRKLKSQIQTSFKLHGFQLQLEACKHFIELLSALDESEWSEWIDKVLEHVQRKGLDSAVINKAILATAIHVRMKENSIYLIKY